MSRPGGVTVVSDPGLNAELELARGIYFRHSGRKGCRKDVAEVLIREALEARRARGWFEDPDRVEGLLPEVDADGEAVSAGLKLAGGAA